jgi:hypothetical protein
MENAEYKLGMKTVWILLAGDLLLLFTASAADILNRDLVNVMLLTGFIMLTSGWIKVLSDISWHRIPNKTIWIVSMFLCPFVSPVVYLLWKNRLVNSKPGDAQAG